MAADGAAGGSLLVVASLDNAGVPGGVWEGALGGDASGCGSRQRAEGERGRDVLAAVPVAVGGLGARQAKAECETGNRRGGGRGWGRRRSPADHLRELGGDLVAALAARMCSRRAPRPNPRHGCSCAWRRCRRLLTRLALSFRVFFGKKGKTRWRWESNPERERRDEVARMVPCVREDEEVDTLNLDRWMWVSKEREEIRSNLDSPF